MTNLLAESAQARVGRGDAYGVVVEPKLELDRHRCHVAAAVHPHHVFVLNSRVDAVEASLENGGTISKWAQLDAFDSAQECRAAGYDYQRRFETQNRNVDLSCIATDDPRLKENISPP